jgi:DNA-directed RNA polymerase specialized sigma24 family protein
VLRVVEGLPYRVITAQLALTPATARKRVQQARARLRTELHASLSSGGEGSEIHTVTSRNVL